MDNRPLFPPSGLLRSLGKRIDREIVLMDRNKEERVYMAQAFNRQHQIPILIREVGIRKCAGIVLPARTAEIQRQKF
jgi:hypothetical protein